MCTLYSRSPGTGHALADQRHSGDDDGVAVADGGHGVAQEHGHDPHLPGLQLQHDMRHEGRDHPANEP